MQEKNPGGRKRYRGTGAVKQPRVLGVDVGCGAAVAVPCTCISAIPACSSRHSLLISALGPSCAKIARRFDVFKGFDFVWIKEGLA